MDGDLLNNGLADERGPHANNAHAVEILDTSFQLLCKLYRIFDCEEACDDYTEALEIAAAVRCLEVGVVHAWPDTIYINAIGVMGAYAWRKKQRQEKRNLMRRLDQKWALINHVLKGNYTWAVKVKAMQAIMALSNEYDEFFCAGYAQWIVDHGGFAVVTSLLQECNAVAKDSSTHAWAEQQQAIPEIVSMLTYLLNNWDKYEGAADAQRRKLHVVSAMDEGLLDALRKATSCTEHAPAARVAAIMGVNSLVGLFFSDVHPCYSLPNDIGELSSSLQFAVQVRLITERKMQLPAATRKQVEAMANVAAATLSRQLVSSVEVPLALQTALLVTLALLLHINEHARVIAIVSGVIAPIQAVLQASRFDPGSTGVFQELQELLHLPDNAAKAYPQLRRYKHSIDNILDESECAECAALSMPLVWGNPLGYDHSSTSRYNITRVAAVMACCLVSSVIAANGLLQVRDPDARGILLRSGLVQDLELLIEQGLGASELIHEENVPGIMRLIGRAKAEAAALHP
eukprot:jgi/Chrzof1/4541/Cz14g17170.t1